MPMYMKVTGKKLTNEAGSIWGTLSNSNLKILYTGI